MATVSSVLKQIEEVRQSAEKMHSAQPEIIGTASVGDVVRQGDLYLICLSDAPASKPTKDRQLAPGSTQGSRHIVTGKCTVGIATKREAVAEAINRIVRGANVPAELVGPVLHCKSGVTITHPEHGWRSLPDGSTWAVIYQRQFAEEILRVQD